MQVEISWYAPTVSVVDVSDDELRAARAEGIDITEPFEVGAWVANKVRKHDGAWVDAIRDDWSEQDPPEVIDYMGYGDPPDWAFDEWADA